MFTEGFMHRLVSSLFVFILLSLASFEARASGDPEGGVLTFLKSIEKKVQTEPEESIKALDSIIKLSIERDYQRALPQAYLLMGEAYKVLNQPELALHFMRQARSYYDDGPELSIKSNQEMNLFDVSDDAEVMAEEVAAPEAQGAGDIQKSAGSSEKDSKRLLSKEPKKKSKLESRSRGKVKSSPPPSYNRNMAEIYEQKQDYGAAGTFYKEYRGQVNDKQELKEIDYAIAETYYNSGQYDKAIKIYERLLQQETDEGNEVGRQKAQANLAASYISKGETDKGLVIYGTALDEVKTEVEVAPEEEEEYKDVVAESNEKVSGALRKQQKFKEEAEVRSRSLEVLDDGVEYLRLAQTYFQDRNYSKSEESVDNFLNDISFDIVDEGEVQVIRDMSERLENQNKPAKAYKYLKNYELLRDSIRNTQAEIQQKSELLGAVGRESMLQLEVLKKDKEISQNTINFLMREATLKEDVVSTQKYLIYLLCLIILLGTGALIYIMRVSKSRRIANQQLALRSLRSQMNPHFIFNALNSVNSFISTSDERSANKFLSEFSKLMRTVMENSEHELISLTKELEILRIYLELEHFRFKDKFSYELKVDENLDEDLVQLPPMMIQPYIENSVWHGLRYKEEKGSLRVDLAQEGSDLKVIVRDDGIGRKRSAELKTKNQMKSRSTALKNIGERIKIFNDLHKTKITVTVDDLNEDGTGTIVTLLIPQNQQE